MAMTMIRPDFTSDMLALRGEMNRMFGSFFDGGMGTVARRWVPAMDMVEEKDHYLVHIDVPGLEEKDIDVSVQDDVLTISGERAMEKESKYQGMHRLERAFGRFERVLQLPASIDPAQVRASCVSGVLEVYIPKPELAKPKKIAIGKKPVLAK